MAASRAGTAPGRIRTHPAPPDGFDARAASPLELRRYGLPQRPDPAIRPELAVLWDDVFSRSLTYITPSFRPIHEVLPGLARPDRPRQDASTVTNGYWSGGVTHEPNYTLDWVTGRWNVPDVEPPGNGSGSFYSFAWIGIDGVTDVTQIGTIQAVSQEVNDTPLPGVLGGQPPLVSKQCYAVYEWWPYDWVVISNLPVSFGDTMAGLICLPSTTEADFYLVNLTTGVLAAHSFSPPPNIWSLENQAEWVMEHPGVPGESPDLPNFGEIYFDSAFTGYGLSFVAEGGPDTAINMVENGTTVATTTIETPTLIKIAYTGG
jgi:hypothetical protein